MNVDASKPSIAVFAGRYPALSETFVRREIEGLAGRGWEVWPVTLRPGEQGPSCAKANIATVYAGAWSIFSGVLAECATHPVRSLSTLIASIYDAVCPDEQVSVAGRVKLVAQAFAGILIASELRRRGVRHVHCHFAHAPTTVGMYAAKQLGIPFSFTGHANDLFQRRSLLRRKLQRAAFVSSISEWHKRLYSEVYPGGSDKYRVIRCGVDVNRWTPRGEFRSPPLRILTVCRLVEKKGIDTLIRAAARVVQQNNTVIHSVTIVGDGPERTRLSQLAEFEGVKNLVVWAGSLPNEQVCEKLCDADLFVLPCREDANGDRDGIPVVLMEAMAAGVPVISGDLPAIRELIINDESGILIDGTSVDEVASAIIRLASDRDLRIKLASGGRERVRSEFSLDENLSRLQESILKALQRSDKQYV